MQRGVASRGRFQPAPSAHTRFFIPRRASARDSSGQASCLPGFGYGQGCFGRGHAPTGGGGLVCQIGMPCPPWSICGGVVLPAVTPAYRVGGFCVQRGVASRGRFQPAPPAHPRFFIPRRASARDSSGQASCLPGFRYGRGCFGRGRAPARGGGLACQIGMPCPQWCFACRGAWQAGFWRQRAGVSACA